MAVKAWQCVGCGNIDAAQTCIGICSYRKVEFVYREEYEEAASAASLARRDADALLTLVRQLAHTTPRNDDWQSTYVAMQTRALAVLKALGTIEPVN